ncbi:MAG: universal stress protein [Persicimonas sp.]
MYQIEQVLVPVDFSTFSRAAVSLARTLGDDKPRVHLSHVLEPWRRYTRSVLFPYAALGEDDVEFEHELIDTAREQLLAHLQLDPEADEDLGHFNLEFGPLGETLGAHIRNTGPDVVIMGAFGEGGARPNVLGSSAEKLLRTCTGPVVLVRDYTPRPSIDHVVVAVDLTSTSTEVVARALGFAMQVEASLEMVYVLPDPLSQDTNKLLAGHLDFDAAHILERSRAKIEALFDRVANHIEVAFPKQRQAHELLANRKVIVGDPASAIVDHADSAGADMIVVGAHNAQSASRQQLGRVAWTVARTTPTHVMVVPPTKEVSLLGDDES